MDGVFPHSQELREIVESHGWTFFDVTGVDGQLQDSTVRLERVLTELPAEKYHVQHAYALVPTAGIGSLLTADENTQIIPTITVPYLVNTGKWFGGCGQKTKKGHMIVRFGLVAFTEEYAACIDLQPQGNEDIDRVQVHYDALLETFREHFKIMNVKEYLGQLARPAVVPKSDLPLC